ncbi:hypothetical protein ANN_10319 [Periplaneta americana]|uniref:Uncharacterized protein n=1 Tax=Periplaneta americana TaxID=6978 RepID=A0ABQ8TP24_PERAM|nr:hypothetical protein ANN_10319 [Periplaneta americana]
MAGLCEGGNEPPGSLKAKEEEEAVWRGPRGKGGGSDGGCPGDKVGDEREGRQKEKSVVFRVFVLYCFVLPNSFHNFREAVMATRTKTTLNFMVLKQTDQYDSDEKL